MSDTATLVVRSLPKHRRVRVVRVLLIGSVLSAVLLFLVVRSVSFGEVWREISAVSLPILSLSLLTRFCNLALGAMRTHVLVRAHHAFPFPSLLAIHLAGFSANNLLPLRFGDLVRIDAMATRGGIGHATCLQVVAIERLFDLLSLISLFLMLSPLISVRVDLGFAFHAALLACAAGLLLLLAIRRRSSWLERWVVRLAGLGGQAVRRFVASRWERFARDLAAIPMGRGAGLAFLLSLATWCVAMVTVMIWLRAFEITLPWYASLMVLMFLSFSMVLPATPGQVGTYHYFVTAALMACGLDKVHSVSVAVVGHAVAILPLTVLGVPFLISLALRRPAGAEPSLHSTGNEIA